MIERGNFEPLSPKKVFDFKGFDFNYRRVNRMSLKHRLNITPHRPTTAL
jgi:hypothetical protein